MDILASPLEIYSWPRGCEFYNYSRGIRWHRNHAISFLQRYMGVEETFKLAIQFHFFALLPDYRAQNTWRMGHEFHDLRREPYWYYYHSFCFFLMCESIKEFWKFCIFGTVYKALGEVCWYLISQIPLTVEMMSQTKNASRSSNRIVINGRRTWTFEEQL